MEETDLWLNDVQGLYLATWSQASSRYVFQFPWRCYSLVSRLLASATL